MIAVAVDLLLGPLGAALGAILAAVVAWFAGRRAARQAAQDEAVKDYRETRRRMDDASDLGDDPDVLREWLRERGRQP